MPDKYDKLQVMLNDFEHTLIDLGIPEETTDQLLMGQLLPIVNYAIDLKLREILYDDLYECLYPEKEGIV